MFVHQRPMLSNEQVADVCGSFEEAASQLNADETAKAQAAMEEMMRNTPCVPDYEVLTGWTATAEQVEKELNALPLSLTM